MNPLLLIDGYKLSHRAQYPPDTRRVYSNWTPRSSMLQDIKRVVFFGLQYFLKKYLQEDMTAHFFSRPKAEVLKEYQTFIDRYLGPGNNVGTDHIAALHDLGYVPLTFRALPEGTEVPLGVPMFTVENTIDEFFWLPNYFETLISSVLWRPCTSATLARRFRLGLEDACRQSGGDESLLDWQAHDFSFRGQPGVEAAVLSGAGHLLSFKGSDSCPVLDFVDRYYGGDNGVVAMSVPATEHSVMSCGGKDSEAATFERLLHIYPEGVLSVVSDTWDLWHVLEHTLPALKAKIMARDGKLVIRPDSGDPLDIICGNALAQAGTAESKGVVQLLWETFGGHWQNGYKHLNPRIGVIYGDAITLDRAGAICAVLRSKGFASTNVVFGVGSYTYQYNTRDTFGFAMKATWADVGGAGRDLFKDPITDRKKRSLRGRISVQKDLDGELVAVDRLRNEHESELRCVWHDGAFEIINSFADVRHRLAGAQA